MFETTCMANLLIQASFDMQKWIFIMKKAKKFLTQAPYGLEGQAHEKIFIGFLAELDNSKAFGKKNFLAFFGLYGLFGLMKAKKKNSVK